MENRIKLQEKILELQRVGEDRSINFDEEIDRLEDESYEISEKVLNDIMPEAFAVIKETAKRFTNNTAITVTASPFDREISGDNDYVTLDGDKAIWAVAGLLALFSFLPVYSASSNLAYLYGDGSTLPYLLKHLAHLLLGFAILYGVHKIPYRYFSGGSVLMLPIVILLLIC